MGDTGGSAAGGTRPAARRASCRASGKSPRFHAPRAAAPTAAAHAGGPGSASTSDPLGPARGLVPDAQVDELGHRRRPAGGEVGVPVGTGRSKAARMLSKSGRASSTQARSSGPADRAPPLGQLDVVVACRWAQRTVGAVASTRSRAVRPQRLQQPVAGVAPTLAATTIDRSTSRAEHGRGRRPRSRPGRRTPGAPPEVGTAREDRQGDEQPLLGAPAAAGRTSRSPRRGSGAGRPGPGPPPSSGAAFQPSRDLDRAHRPHPGRGELDTQRQSVEAARRSRRRRRRWRGRAGSRVGHGPRPLHEERHGVVDGSGGTDHMLLARDPERFPTGGEHRHGGAVLHDPGDQPAARVEHVLAVVHAPAARPGRAGTRSRSARSSDRTVAARRAPRRRRARPGRRPGGTRARRATRRRGSGRVRGAATSIASRDLPTPPTPVRVTSAATRSASPTPATSSSAADERGHRARQVASAVARPRAPGRAPGSAGSACSASWPGSTPSSSSRWRRRAW